MPIHYLTMFLLFKEIWSCGYDTCTALKKGTLNVHIVPHTHNDLGWTNTIDGYYEQEVKKILDSVVLALLEDNKRRFIYVETAFFWRWWNNQKESIKRKVKMLVNEGRLKFVGGAWSMNDEATTQYQSIIDQFTWGLRKLNDTFGPCATPSVAWQIDTFGHSREFASLLAAMGYDGVFLCRISSDDLTERRQSKTMEFIWRGDDDLGNSSDIFTGILFDHYTPPIEFNLEVINADAIIEAVNNISKSYVTNNILIAMGKDFDFIDANKTFNELDLLITAVNNKIAYENLNITIFYSTPDCYLKALRETNITLSVKRDDFFPYSTINGDWTGYYTSRPSLKYLERETNRYFQMVKQLYVTTGLDDNFSSIVLDELRSAMGVMQHHDAITGTEKQFVAEDYKKIMHQAVNNILFVADKAFSKLARKHAGPTLFSFNKCQLNQSECSISESSQKFILFVYNPLAWEVPEVDINIPVTKANYIIYGPDTKKITTNLVPIVKWYIKNIPARQSIATHELVFKAKKLKPLGFQSFYIEKVKRKTHVDVAKVKVFIQEETFKYGSSIMTLVESGYYTSFQNSGAYVFSPDEAHPTLVHNFTLYNYNRKYRIDNEVNAILKQFKIIRNVTVLHIVWLCKPISLEDVLGKEVIVRYKTTICNKDEFYTDSNGRQMIKRKRKPKLLQNQDEVTESSNRNKTMFLRKYFESPAGNYYPVANKIYIKDGNIKFTVITDRAEGGFSPIDGTVELMINRRFLHDDGLGVAEALNENTANIINHFIIISEVNNEQSVINEKKLNFEINLSPIMLFSDAKKLSLDDWLKLEHSGAVLNQNLPDGLHLLTLEPWGRWKLLLRLENYLERSGLNKGTIKIDVCKIFSTITLKSLMETTLAANRWLNKTKKWVWRKRADFADSFKRKKQELGNGKEIIKNGKCAQVKLRSKQIRTFIAVYRMKFVA